jgi:hypothetical protein
MPEATDAKGETLVSAPQIRGEWDGYAPPAPVTACKPVSSKVRPAGGAGPAKNPAEWMFDRLVRLIDDFEKGLSDAEEVGGRMVGAPGDATFHIDDIGFWGPDLIMFYGKNQHGRPVRLIQHYTQISVLLTSVPKEKEQEKPRRIGFIWREQAEEPAAASAEPEAAAEAEAHPS